MEPGAVPASAVCAVSVAGIILAGGASTRLGQPKQLVELGGERLLERAVRTARQAGLSPVIVVVGARAAEITAQCDLREAQIVRCERWAEGMSQALASGVAAVAETNAASCVVLTSDMPFVTPLHLQALTKRRGEVRASGYDGRKGIPAHFPRGTFRELQHLEGDTGARDLLQSAPSVDLGADALDIDTPEDLAAARARFATVKRLRKGAR